MAVGDLNNFIKRINQNLPPWFGEDDPLLQAFIKGFATTDEYIYSLLSYVEDQMRIQTSTGENLDLEACDYFGDNVQRTEGMNDNKFRQLILSTLLQPMATVQGMIDAITALTGNVPLIFEPFGPQGNAFYNQDFYYNENSYYGGYAPYNFWITVFVNAPENNFGYFNMPDYCYNESLGNFYYGGSGEYVFLYDEILSVVNRVKVGGTVPHLTVIYI